MTKIYDMHILARSSIFCEEAYVQMCCSVLEEIVEYILFGEFFDYQFIKPAINTNKSR